MFVSKEHPSFCLPALDNFAIFATRHSFGECLSLFELGEPQRLRCWWKAQVSVEAEEAMPPIPVLGSGVATGFKSKIEARCESRSVKGAAVDNKFSSPC